jgi:hypothetical protein
MVLMRVVINRTKLTRAFSGGGVVGQTNS